MWVQYVKNIKLYQVYSLFTDTIIIGPIIMVYLLAKGLSFPQVMILQSVAAVAIAVLEVPTGALADRVSRKLSIILGAVITAVGLLMLVATSSFAGLILVHVLLALGFTFKSGADTALIYDTLKVLDRIDEFQNIEGRAHAKALWMQAAGSIVAGFAYEINIHLPMLLSTVFMLLTALVAVQFQEVDIREHASKPGYFKQIAETGCFVVRHVKVRALILYAMVFFVFYRYGFFLFQPYMSSVGIPVRYFGVLFFLFNMVAALTSRKADSIMRLTRNRTLMALSGLMIVSFLLLGLVRFWLGVAAMLLQQMARGLYRPALRKYINKHTPSPMRATVLSFYSLLTQLGSAAANPLLGIAMAKYGVFSTHLLLAAAMTVMAGGCLKYMSTRIGARKSTLEHTA